MTLSEFKAWFEGLSESMEAPPTEDQWKRIKTRVAEINGTATPYPVVVDRYVTSCRRYHDSPLWNGDAGCGGNVALLSSNAASPKMESDFNAPLAMADLGRAGYNLDLFVERAKRNAPDADCVKTDMEGRQMGIFALDYVMDGRTWSVDLWAYSFEDAENRAVAMRETAVIGGQIKAIIPA
jgi:hypothetical protein